MNYSKYLAVSAAALLACTATAASATQIILAPTAVIGSSGAYDPRFVAGNILDQQTGTINETFANGYWINPDNGPANAYITIDLGAAYSLTGFELFNTHNGNYGDRGTGAFTIIGGNSISDLGGGNFTLTGTTFILANGTLSASPVSGALAGQNFASLNNGAFRYLQFLPTGVASANGACCGSNVYGLNELRVSAVPEPATWAMMLAGFGLMGFGLRRRAKQTVRVAFA
jgi:hypothetical protein